MEEVEDTVNLEREMTTDSEVAETTIHWVPDVRHTRGHDTHYWRIVELYWHIKTFMGQMIQTREDTQNIVQLQLNGLHLMVREILVDLPSAH
jgi:hypothetical protein